MSLREQAQRALKWSWLQAGLGALIQFASTAVMARLLVPADFGLVALATVFVRFLAYFSQMGVAVAIVQREVIRPGELSALASLSVVIGGCFTCLGLVLANFVDNDVASILRALSASFVITSFSAVPYGLLRRELRNRDIAVIELIGQVVGCIVGITTAAAGAGVWSIVCGVLTQQVLVAGGAWYAVGRGGERIGFGRFGAASRSYLRYGLRHSFNTFLEFLYYNVEVLIIGRWFGVQSTGLCNRAQALSHLPVEQVLGSVVRVLFPVLSRVRGNPDRERTAFLAAFLLSGIFATTFSAAMFSSAPEIVLVMLGPGWEGAIPVLRVLSIAVPCRYLVNLQSAWLDAVGALRPRTATILGCGALKAIAFVLAIHYEMALPVLLALIILPDVAWQLAYSGILPRVTTVHRRVLLAANLLFLTNAVFVGMCVSAVTWELRGVGWSPYPTLVMQVGLGVALAATTMTLVVRSRMLGLRPEQFGGIPLFGQWLAGSAGRRP